MIITTMMVNTWSVFRYDKKMIREEMEAKARSIAVSLSLEGTEAMLENLYLIQNSLANFSKLPDVSQIVFIDDSNMITAANDTTSIGDDLSKDPLFINAVKQQREFLQYYTVDKTGVEMLAIFEPMILNGQIHGWIRLDLSLKGTGEKIRKRFIQLLFLAIFIAGIGILPTFWISHKISAVLSNLVGKFKKLESGDFTEKLYIRSNDELGEVALSYNFLVDQMRGMVDKLQQKRQRAEAELKDSEEFFRALYENAKHPVYLFGEDLRFIDVNPYCCGFYGYSRQEFKNMSLLDLMAPEDRDVQKKFFEDLRKEGDLFIKELKQRKRNGEIVTITLDNVSVTRGGKGFYVGLITDITERKLAEERLIHMANYDGLTNLPNRLLFADRLNQALLQAKRNRTLVAVLFLDLDQFKLINDTLGHPVGDRLLQAISKILVTGRETDTVTRLGGDEFTIILTNISHATDAARVAEKILNLLSVQAFYIEGHEIFITASIGITLYPQDGEDMETLLKNADTAMYYSKERGRNSYQFYIADMNDSALERLDLETCLRRAVEKEELLLYYQPIVDLSSGQVVAAEALLRWRHPNRGLLLPEQFIYLVEETGLIIPIGEWVLKTASRQNQAWQKAGFKPIHVAVNISVYQFQAPKFMDSVKNVLKESELDPHNLELEVTESNLMQNVERTRLILHQLNQMGVKISVDDFGTGYSSLSYLKRLPIDTLKIDRSFILDINENPDDQAIATAIIAMAHSLKLKVIAEGVENHKQIEFLLSRRCDRAQGFLFSSPLTAKEFEEFLEKTP
ncbi:MAG: EAL domain-containing protein [Nitrospirae bacterium]|nr:EAL domain-containing protein [Nitrospirota bacterium]